MNEKMSKDFYNLLVQCQKDAENYSSVITIKIFLLNLLTFNGDSIIRDILLQYKTESQLDEYLYRLSDHRVLAKEDWAIRVLERCINEKTGEEAWEAVKKNYHNEYPDGNWNDFLRYFYEKVYFTIDFFGSNIKVDYELAFIFTVIMVDYFRRDPDAIMTIELVEMSLMFSNDPLLKIVFEDFLGKNNIDLQELLDEKFELQAKQFSKSDETVESDNQIEDDEFEEDTELEIPDSIAGFISVLNDKFKVGDRCEIQKRDEEIHQVWTKALKREKPNSILVGPAGVGKTAIIEKITWQIVNKQCPKKFYGYSVLELSVNNIMAGTEYRGSTERRFKAVMDFLKSTPKVILFIDEIHTIIGAGNTMDSPAAGLDDALKPLLARGDARVIGATTEEEYEKYFKNKGALKRRFEKIYVDEPTPEEIYPMIQKKIEALEEYHEVKISKEMVDFIIPYAYCMNQDVKNPDRTIDAIDNIMVNTALLDKTEVDKESIMKTFEKSFKQFDNMKIEDKRAIAYHEVGHYLLWSNYKKDSNKELVAMSIIPADNHLGCNAFYLKDNNCLLKDREFFIRVIAELLAGRVAEEKYTGKISSGAQSDLQKATNYAQKLVVDYGMGKEIGKDRVYYDSRVRKMFYDDLNKKIDKEIDLMISEARTLAENVLNEKMAVLNNIVEELIKKGLLTKDELDKLEELD